MNMKKKEGQRILQQLAQQSDVMIENYVPGAWWPQAHGRKFAYSVLFEQENWSPWVWATSS